LQLVEQHAIKRSDPRFAAIDAAAFSSKNLYNQITYHYRQAFIHEGVWLSYAEVFHRIKHLACYHALPRKVSNSILIAVDKNWRSFRNALKAWRIDPSSFTGKPRIPKYKHKERGRNILIYDKQALGLRAFKKTGTLVPSGLPIAIATRIPWEQIDQVRVVPRANGYVVEVVYQQEQAFADVDPAMIAALDLGVNTLVACTSTKPGFQPLLVNGRPLKSINQHYNKHRAHYQSRLAKANRFTSHRLDRMTAKRHRRVNAYLHATSRRIIDHHVGEGIGTLVVGKNPLWKQQVTLGREIQSSLCANPACSLD
jgi:putative transposase